MKILTTVSFALLLVLLYMSCIGAYSGLAATSSAEKKEDKDIAVDIYNPYALNVNLEVKCDWSVSEKKYSYHKKFIARAGSKTRVFIPVTIKKCQIWPSARLF